MKNNFINSLDGLYKYNVPREHIIPLTYKVLSIKFQVKNSIKDFQIKAIKQQKQFEAKVNELAEHYYAELDSTAYTALNVLTDLVSHQEYDVIPNYAGRESGLQKKIYEWARDFPNVITESNFSWELYTKI